jgi:hypothetical protein
MRLVHPLSGCLCVQCYSWHVWALPLTGKGLYMPTANSSANGVRSKGSGTTILLVRAPTPCTAVPLRSISALNGQCGKEIRQYLQFSIK